MLDIIVAVKHSLAVMLLACSPAAFSEPAMRNPDPLPQTPFRMLRLTSVKPQGWLGGTGESWERGPYFMNGLVPLAFLLDDPALIAKAHRWVSWTLENQRGDGAIGPVKNTDWWPNFVML